MLWLYHSRLRVTGVLEVWNQCFLSRRWTCHRRILQGSCLSIFQMKDGRIPLQGWPKLLEFHVTNSCKSIIPNANHILIFGFDWAFEPVEMTLLVELVQPLDIDTPEESILRHSGEYDIVYFFFLICDDFVDQFPIHFKPCFFIFLRFLIDQWNNERMNLRQARIRIERIR